PEISKRYEIIEGVRYFMSSPTWDHQTILFNIAKLLDRYTEASGNGYARPAPLDVLIRRIPRLQTRQPDVLLITHERLREGGGIPRKGPLPVGPELVVEIVSDTERAAALSDKLRDYRKIGVQEAWVVRPQTRTVELTRLTSDGTTILAVFGERDRIR